MVVPAPGSWNRRGRKSFCSSSWSLTPVPDKELWNLEFAGWQVCFILMRWLCIGSWIRLATRKTKPWLEPWNFQPCLLYSWPVEMELIDHDKASMKISILWSSRRFRWVNTAPYRSRVAVKYLSSMETEAPVSVLWTLPDLALCISPLSCLSLSFSMSFSKPVNVSKCFAEFCELF